MLVLAGAPVCLQRAPALLVARSGLRPALARPRLAEGQAARLRSGAQTVPLLRLLVFVLDTQPVRRRDPDCLALG